MLSMKKSAEKKPLVAGAEASNDDVISEQELDWKQKINRKLLEILDLSLIETIGEEKARVEIRENVNRLLSEESAPLSLRQRQSVMKMIEDDIMGLGPLEPLLADATVSDILVNGYHTIYVERRGRLERTNLRFTDHLHLMNTIDRIVSAVGRRVDESSPMVDARLKVHGIEGLRVADASIMPQIVSGNTNAPAIMIGEKCSDLVLEDAGDHVPPLGGEGHDHARAAQA